MTMFVVEVTPRLRYLMEADSAEQAEQLVWEHRNIAVDWRDLPDTTVNTITQTEFADQHPENPPLILPF
jgi:hypothetical protein